MRRTSRWLVLGAIVVVATAAAVVIAVARSGGDESAAQECRLVTPPSAAAPAPGSSGIKVTEQGYTTVPPDFPSNATTFPRVSIGAVLENTTDRVAYRTRVVFDAFGSSGASVVTGPQATYKMIEVPILPPGARVAVGDTLVADEKATISKVSISPTVTQWLPPGGPNSGLAPITAAVVTGKSARESDGSSLITFTAHSPNCTDLLSRGTAFVLRDTSGKIVGGNVDGLTKQEACQVGGTTTPVTAMSQQNTVPATADLDKTEITAFCDVAKGPGIIRSGEPIN
ncbi:MAG TPA: hypothetical protein VGQ92_01210 [Actinoplanes sp.]|nr:hypothetical protein [Actinoplanes sp.]